MVTSEKKKILRMMELTVQYEDGIEDSREAKKSKYQKIVDADESKGWKVILWAVEVGCRDFPAVSFGNYLGILGF